MLIFWLVTTGNGKLHAYVLISYHGKLHAHILISYDGKLQVYVLISYHGNRLSTRRKLTFYISDFWNSRFVARVVVEN